MTASVSAKKRPRSPSEDCEECMPISKRINRLHIESSRQSTEGLEANQTCSPVFPAKSEDLHLPCQMFSPSLNANSNIDIQNNTMSAMLSNNNILPDNSSNSNCMACNSEQSAACYQELLQGYKPELGKQENPEYYSINRLLFEVHVERAKRLRIDDSSS